MKDATWTKTRTRTYEHFTGKATIRPIYKQCSHDVDRFVVCIYKGDGSMRSFDKTIEGGKTVKEAKVAGETHLASN